MLSLLVPGPAGGLLADIVVGLFSIPAAAAVMAAASDSYLGREVTVGGSARRAASRSLTLWLAAIAQGALMFIGFILLIVPAFIFFAWTAVMPPVVMLEHAGVNDAFTRSRALAKGDVLRIVGMVGVTTILVVLLTFAVTAAVLLVAGGESRLGTAAGNFVTILVYPIVPVVTTLLYYDLRIRKEGFDLELLADSLGASSGAPGGASGGGAQSGGARGANWS